MSDKLEPTGSDPLEFTGERFTPECVREIRYEHVHRYAFARDLVRGRAVLDAACGEGYGARLLAAAATICLAPVLPATAERVSRELFGMDRAFRWTDLESHPARIAPYKHLMTRVATRHIDALFEAPA